MKNRYWKWKFMPFPGLEIAWRLPPTSWTTWVRCKEKPQISKTRNSILRKISTAIKASYYNKILAKNNLFDSVTISKQEAFRRDSSAEKASIFLIIKIKRWLLLLMSISDSTSNDINHKIDNASMSWMRHLRDIF